MPNKTVKKIIEKNFLKIVPEVKPATLTKTKPPRLRRGLAKLSEFRSDQRSEIQIDEQPKTYYLEHQHRNIYQRGTFGVIKRLYETKTSTTILKAVKIYRLPIELELDSLNEPGLEIYNEFHQELAKRKIFANREAKINNLLGREVEWGEIKNKFYVFMPWIEGQNLREFIKTNSFTETNLVEFVYYLREVEILHSLGLIIGDPKLNNAMRDAKQSIIKLIDFDCIRFEEDEIGGVTRSSISFAMNGKAEQRWQQADDIYCIGDMLSNLMPENKKIQTLVSKMQMEDPAERITIQSCINAIADIVPLPPVPDNIKNIHDKIQKRLKPVLVDELFQAVKNADQKTIDGILADYPELINSTQHNQLLSHYGIEQKQFKIVEHLQSLNAKLDIVCLLKPAMLKSDEVTLAFLLEQKQLDPFAKNAEGEDLFDLISSCRTSFSDPCKAKLATIAKIQLAVEHIDSRKKDQIYHIFPDLAPAKISTSPHAFIQSSLTPKDQQPSVASRLAEYFLCSLYRG